MAEEVTKGEVTKSATVERLLEAAEAEFATRGYAEARLEDIAAAVGVRRASLLYHFATKMDLYERVLERAFGDLRALLVAAIGRPAATYAERLDDVVARSVDIFTRRPLFSRLLLRDAIDHHPQAAERTRIYVLPLLEIGEAFLHGGRAAKEFREEVEPRQLLLFFTGAIIFHASTSEGARDVLWGQGRASGRGLRAYRDGVRAMVRQLAVIESPTRLSPAQTSRPSPMARAKRASASSLVSPRQAPRRSS